jgi:Family of unknown function (DUF5335)
MKPATGPNAWKKYTKFFSEQNAGRSTRIGVFDRDGDVVTDYWLESGLPLTGIDMETRDERVSVQIIVGKLTHEVNDAIKLVFPFSHSGDEDGIDICTADGGTTILRFEGETGDI